MRQLRRPPKRGVWETRRCSIVAHSEQSKQALARAAKNENGAKPQKIGGGEGVGFTAVSNVVAHNKSAALWLCVIEPLAVTALGVKPHRWFVFLLAVVPVSA
jgi:hypothetical protein